MKKGELSTTIIAKIQKVSRQYCYELLDKYERFGDDGLKDKQAGRPKKLIPKEIEDIVTTTYQERPIGAVMMEKYIEKKHGIHGHSCHLWEGESSGYSNRYEYRIW